MLGRVSLKRKLAAGFGVVLLVLVALGTTSYFSVRKLSELSAAADDKGTEAFLIRSIDSLANNSRTDIRSFLLTGKEETMSQFDSSTRQIVDDISKVEPLLTTTQSKELMIRLRKAQDAYGHEAEKVVQLQRARNTRAAQTFLFGPEMDKARDEMNQTVAEFIDQAVKLKSAAREEQAGAESKTMTLIPILLFIGILIGLGTAIVTSRSVTRAAINMEVMIQQVAANNLSMDDLEITSEDEIGRASVALNTMKNGLRELILNIVRVAEQVASASEEISSSATQQAGSAETQKGQASQVANAMREMSSAVEDVAKHSTRAADASRQVAETARVGGTIVDDSLAKMRNIAHAVSATARKVEELGKSSDQIGRIIGVIDDIADQTNLLALNAAIEAARAGEQGRGFAVVADEVRKLAERTTSATKEVAQMVQTIQTETRTAVTAMQDGTKQVEEGVQTTAQAGNSLKQIIQMAEQVGEMIAHIATAATEQSSTTEQVNQNVAQIATLVKESAVGAQQSAKACQDLSGLALDLQKMVSHFNLDKEKQSKATNMFGEGRSGFGAYQPGEMKAFAASAR